MSGAARQSIPRPMQLDEFRLVLQDHLRWLQSEGKDGRRANLSAHDLSSLPLGSIYLPDANLRAADLSGVNLADANLQGADFSEAVLENTNFRGAQLEGANFARCMARGAYFDGASLINANFSNASMEDASCVGVNFGGAKFRDAVVNGVDFSRANLQHTNFRHVTALECIFEGADLSHADCRDGLFNYGRFKGATVMETQCRNAQFEHVLFTEADFTHALDLETHYQSESIESEKRNIHQELENLRQFREEVGQYERHINEQKKELLTRRKMLEGLNDMESDISGALVSTMRLFRNISVFWFVVVTLFATILFYRIKQMEYENMNYIEIAIVLAVLVGVLGAHILSAVLSFNVAKKFARHVRMRRERLMHPTLAKLDGEVAAVEGPDGENAPAQGEKQKHEPGVTYL